MRKYYLAMSTVFIAGCVGTKAGAYRVFAEDLDRLSRKAFDEAYVYNIGHLAETEPDSVKLLKGGNEIRVYTVKPPNTQVCTVLIEVDKQTNHILDASSKGPECWRAY